MYNTKKVSKMVFCNKIQSNVKMSGTYALEPYKEDKPNGKVFYRWKLLYIETTCPNLKDGRCYDRNDCIANDYLADILPH